MDETNRDVMIYAVWRLALDLAGGQAVPVEAQGRLDLIHRMLDNALGLAAAGPPSSRDVRPHPSRARGARPALGALREALATGEAAGDGGAGTSDGGP